MAQNSRRTSPRVASTYVRVAYRHLAGESIELSGRVPQHIDGPVSVCPPTAQSNGGRPPTHLSAERPLHIRQNAHEGTGRSPTPRQHRPRTRWQAHRHVGGASERSDCPGRATAGALRDRRGRAPAHLGRRARAALPLPLPRPAPPWRTGLAIASGPGSCSTPGSNSSPSATG
jgi:hypothetical protein